MQTEDNEALRRKAMRKNDNKTDLNKNSSTRKQEKTIKKVVNPFDKEKSNKIEASKNKNNIIETIGKSRFAELLTKFSGNGQSEPRPNLEVKECQISNNINQRIGLLLNCNNNKTEPKQSAVIDEISQPRKNDSENKEKSLLNTKNEDKDSDCDDLDLGDNEFDMKNETNAESNQVNTDENSNDNSTDY